MEHKIESLEDKIESLNEEVEQAKGKQKEGFNYIIHVREFKNLNQNIYKIGRTKSITKRFRQYPKGSLLLHCRKSNDDAESEALMLHQLKNLFIHRQDLGREYFEGDFDELKEEFDKIVQLFQN